MKQMYIFSSVGQKQLMALSGLGWAIFVLMHMLGNLLIFLGDEAYNKYSHALTSNPGILLAELGLLILLLTHVFYGIKTAIENAKARSVPYATSKTSPKEASLASRTMKYHGILLLLFIILHLVNFKFGAYYTVTYNETPIRDIFRLVVEKFQSPLYVSIYVASVSLLGFHLSHGLYSALQSLGFYNEKYMIVLKKCSMVYGIIIAVGFSLAPLYILFFY